MRLYDLDQLHLAKATRDHYQPILDISEGVYDGLDYFTGVYYKWITQEEVDPMKRRNIVLLDADDRVIGFQSYMFQDGGKRVLVQALRIDPSLKGMGVGKKFMELCREFIARINKEVKGQNMLMSQDRDNREEGNPHLQPPQMFLFFRNKTQKRFFF